MCLSEHYWCNLLIKETTDSIHLTSSFPKKEIKNIFENSPSKEVLCRDKPSCINQPKSSNSESSLLDNSNINQPTEDNFNKT